MFGRYFTHSKVIAATVLSRTSRFGYYRLEKIVMNVSKFLCHNLIKDLGKNDIHKAHKVHIDSAGGAHS